VVPVKRKGTLNAMGLGDKKSFRERRG